MFFWTLLCVFNFTQTDTNTKHRHRHYTQTQTLHTQTQTLQTQTLHTQTQTPHTDTHYTQTQTPHTDTTHRYRHYTHRHRHHTQTQTLHTDTDTGTVRLSSVNISSLRDKKKSNQKSLYQLDKNHIRGHIFVQGFYFPWMVPTVLTVPWICLMESLTKSAWLKWTEWRRVLRYSCLQTGINQAALCSYRQKVCADCFHWS